MSSSTYAILETGVAVRVVMSSQPKSELPEIPLISAKGVDYSLLQDLLKAGEWQEADRETAARMLEAVGRQEQGWLKIESIDNFPCADLCTIDQLWVTYSQGRFGFSVQAEIYRSLGGTRSYDQKIWEAFCDRIGWCQHGDWLQYSELTFDTSAPKGHLPEAWAGDSRRTWAWFGKRIDGVLFSRIEACELELTTE